MKIPRKAFQEHTGETFVSFRWNFSPWEGKSMLRLPHFTDLLGFAHALLEGKPIHFRPAAEGEKLSPGKIEDPAALDPLTPLAWLIEMMGRARDLSDRCGIAIVFPRLVEMTPDNYERLAIAYSVLIEGEFSMPGAGAWLRMTMNRGENDPAALVAQYEQVALEGFAVKRPSETLTVFGTAIELGAVVYSLAPTVGVFSEPGRSDFLAGRASKVEVEFRGTKESLFRVTPGKS